MTEEAALIDRIRQIIEQKGLNSSDFATQIGSSRSVITHILNGRNNPSWDILKKILEKYENINTEWLLFGKGPMYKSERSIIRPEKHFVQPSLFDKLESKVPEITIKPVKGTPPPEYRKEIEDKLVEKPIKQIENEEVIQIKTELKKIVKIMIYYSDNTFGSFTPDMKPFE